MKEIDPSPDFVENVMAGIYQYETEKRRFLTTSAIGNIAANAGAIIAALIGIVNLIRLFASVYAPVVCH